MGKWQCRVVICGAVTVLYWGRLVVTEEVHICQELYCEIPLCEQCLYPCEGGCQKSYCADHIIRQVDGVMWCEACVRAHVVELNW